MIRKLSALLYLVFIYIAISCSGKGMIKEIEYNGDNENAQYIDKSSTIKGILNNSANEKDIDIYRLVYSNDYILSVSLKQNKNTDIQISLNGLNDRHIFSLVKKNNIKIPLYSVKDKETFLRLESIDSSEKINYTLKIDFIEDYYNNIAIEPNNTFNDAINILAPNISIEGSFVNIEHYERAQAQVITNTSFNNISDVDIYRLRNPTDITLNIDVNIDSADKLETLLFDSKYNLISKHSVNSIPLLFQKNTTYYIALVYYSTINEVKKYKIMYTIKE